MRAKLARGQLRTLLWRSKTTDIKVQHKLFMALTTSILLYGQPICGLNWIEDIEKFQTNFLRERFGLTNSTPDYFLRIETGIPNIKTYIFKELVKFLYRMMTSKSEICRASLEEAKANKSEKREYNWWGQVEDIFKQAGLQSELPKLSPEYIEEKGSELIANYCQKLLNDDVEKLKKDRRLNYYSEMKTHVTTSKYLLEELTWQEKKLTINLRSNFPSICLNGKRYSLNAIWKYWKGGEEHNVKCELCNLDETEDVYHVMYRCPHYLNPRNNYLREYPAGNYEDLMKILYQDDNEMYRKFYKFWCVAMKIRLLYLREMEEE